MNRLERLAALDTSVWVDALVAPEELARLVRHDAVTGLTSNPTILRAALLDDERPAGETTHEDFAVLRLQATAEGIDVNVTLLFGVKAYESVVDAYINGLEDRLLAGRPVDGIASVASFFVSRLDTAVDRELARLGRDHGVARATLDPAAARTARAALGELARAGVELDSITNRLVAEGIAAFAESMNELLAGLGAGAARKELS